MLAQSLARELGPMGVHVGHVVIDGPIDTPFVAQLVGDATFSSMRTKGALLKPDDIADAYLALHLQPKSAWTHELDLRPFAEKF